MNTIKTKKGVAVVCNSIKREDIREPFFHEEKESYPGMELIDDDGVPLGHRQRVQQEGGDGGVEETRQGGGGL